MNNKISLKEYLKEFIGVIGYTLLCGVVLLLIATCILMVILFFILGMKYGLKFIDSIT